MRATRRVLPPRHQTRSIPGQTFSRHPTTLYEIPSSLHAHLSHRGRGDASKRMVMMPRKRRTGTQNPLQPSRTTIFGTPDLLRPSRDENFCRRSRCLLIFLARLLTQLRKLIGAWTRRSRLILT
ncbi:unnamed protein product [Mycena citricolor]|uniref:Uncharacterized protein n=1 Tax=Mycena citricolor TaxID=2018698 RepID=A0AAD2GU79_9AGAR|nr:unnamed protein product [Mycena citricolor]